MGKIILLIEDHYATLDSTAKALKKAGHDVTMVTGIEAAEDYFPGKPRARPFNCLIIDLNMRNTYLESRDNDGKVDEEKTKELKRKTHGGALTGWVWWYNVAKEKFPNAKIIIFSAFTGELEDEMTRTDEFKVSEEEKSYFESDVITVVTKETANGGNQSLIETLKEIFKAKKNK